ncbi:MAG: hypothetical protein H6581_22915 [Bacteroidia bacterium]|nr:hypothetical protein [Bacteroidia bacterium]
MNIHSDKTQKSKNLTVANTVAQKRNGAEPTFQFVDNRPEAVVQRKLQEKANNSIQVSKLSALQGMANNSPRIKQAAHLRNKPEESPEILDVPLNQQVVQRAIKITGGSIVSWFTDKKDIRYQVEKILGSGVDNEVITKLEGYGNDGLTHEFNSWEDAISSVRGEEEPPKGFGDNNLYEEFMSLMAEIDTLQSPPVERQKNKVDLLVKFHDHLKKQPIQEIYKFGTMLQGNIEDHEKTDTIEDAYEQNRAIYRSWHEPGRISESTELGAQVAGGNELVGADGLNVTQSPYRFMKHKAETKKPEAELAPIGAVPSSLLYSGQKNTVFNKDRGTATALLPENLYAGFSAYNETVKSLLREKSLEELGNGAEVLRDHAKFMRAFVTRPVFYDKNDIQSSTGAYLHSQKPGLNVRKTHSGLSEDHNPLMETLDQKLQDPFRANAIFYQTFTEHSKANPYAEEWNEMVVKYRSTGHTAGLHENIRKWVPGLQPHSIIDQLEDSGKFDQEYANQTAKFSDTTLRGMDFD